LAEYLKRMARYNQWMNQKLYAKAQLLSAEELAQDRGAFFESILGTLNHILVADLFWFRRFATSETHKKTLAPLQTMPTPTGLRDLLFNNIQDLQSARESMDKLILTFSDTWNEQNLKEIIHYRNMKGENQGKTLGDLLQHVVNHQTHHRGQATTLLFQAGIDPAATDLLVMMMEERIDVI